MMPGIVPPYSPQHPLGDRRLGGLEAGVERRDDLLDVHPLRLGNRPQIVRSSFDNTRQ
jgi:hypothetical protein